MKRVSDEGPSASPACLASSKDSSQEAAVCCPCHTERTPGVKFGEKNCTNNETRKGQIMHIWPFTHTVKGWWAPESWCHAGLVASGATVTHTNMPPT
jgi:hypothetical protein